MGRARQQIRSITSDRFTATFGKTRGNTGERDLTRRRDTPAARAHLATLTHAVMRGQMEESLALLRERTVKDDYRPFCDRQTQPLVDAICAYARACAMKDDWLMAARRFCELTKLEKPRFGESLGTERTVFGTLDRDAYLTALELWLPSELRRGISHLRNAKDVEDWLVACGVQGALTQTASERLRSPDGEAALQRIFGEFQYSRYFARAQAVGLPGVHACLQDISQLGDRLSWALPAGPGDYQPNHEDAAHYENASLFDVAESGLSPLERQS